jgi:uncharacterized protein (DUF983 family)
VEHSTRPVSIPDSVTPRFLTTFGRAFRGKCPYCGGGGIFRNFTTLHERCPNCETLFAYEDGYFLGSYAINVVAIIFIGVALVFGLIGLTDLSVLQMQIAGVAIVLILPILLYPLSLLVWMALDITLHPPGDFSHRPRR